MNKGQDAADRVRVRWDTDRGSAPARKPQWRELPYDVRLLLRPLSGLAAVVIEGRLASDLADLGAVMTRTFGVEPHDLDLMSDPGLAAGWSYLHVSCLRAAALIADWNLADADGAALPITEANIRRLFLTGPRPGTGGVMLAAFNDAVNRWPSSALEGEADLEGDAEGTASAEADARAARIQPPEGGVVTEGL